ncbi:MAG: hypothetical protein QXJ32_00325 [Thermoplasmata archaeon]
MPERVSTWNQKYLQIETSCRTTYHCVPCTYPNCQRNLKLKKIALKSFGRA